MRRHQDCGRTDLGRDQSAPQKLDQEDLIDQRLAKKNNIHVGLAFAVNAAACGLDRQMEFKEMIAGLAEGLKRSLNFFTKEGVDHEEEY